MKKAVAFLLLIISSIILNGCAEQSTTDNTIPTKAPVLEVSEEKAVDIDNLKSGEYRISDIPGKIKVIKKYHVYSLDNEYTPEMCTAQGVDIDEVTKYLKLTKEHTNVNMILVPANEPLVSPNFEIQIKVKDKYAEIKNLNDLSEPVYETTASALVAGFNTDYETYKTNNVKWIVFDCFVSTNQVRYATILNGKMIYIFGQNKSGTVTDEQRNDIKEIVDSFEFVLE